ncbi:MAG: hypothetical protein K2H20_04845 [Bacilli bacterium]|nr:hypothetical protein [Bacilli bacterium]
MVLTKDEEIIRRGYSPNPKIILPNSALMKTLTTLENCEIVTAHYKVHKVPLEEALLRSKSFLDENFKLHKVLTIKPIKLVKKCLSVYFPVHPYKIPLSSIESPDIFNGSVVEYLPKGTDKTIIKNIILNSPTTEHTSIQYVHEIAHTQVDSQKGCLNNYYDAEVLSIFLELVHAFSIDSTENLLRINDSRRILEMLTISEQLLSIPRIYRATLIENSKYLCSGLKAYNLFITYYYGPNAVRKEMLKSVSQVFNGEITVEDMLAKYDITFENSQDEKKLMKYFNR